MDAHRGSTPTFAQGQAPRAAPAPTRRFVVRQVIAVSAFIFQLDGADGPEPSPFVLFWTVLIVFSCFLSLSAAILTVFFETRNKLLLRYITHYRPRMVRVARHAVSRKISSVLQTRLSTHLSSRLTGELGTILSAADSSETESKHSWSSAEINFVTVFRPRVLHTIQTDFSWATMMLLIQVSWLPLRVSWLPLRL